ncbi:MAG: glycosyltransferase family 2 protein [Candidatus Kerfeldbacteria bacterium]|nr:glycosyltransferase family 2 protein [Candidatus Kerfeldbacteria bacterium]
MDISIVIVSWNVKPLLKRCIASIRKDAPGAEIIVVDNASHDGSADMVADESGVRLIRNATNRGFAAATNQGLRVASRGTLLLLNPDAALQPGAATALVSYLQNHPAVGIVGPRLVAPDGEMQRSVRAFPQLSDQVLILLKLHHLMPRMPSLRRYFMHGFDAARTQPVDQVMGAAFAFRRDVLDRVGAFDESFFVWFEEVDYCRRAADAGLSVHYLAEPAVTHIGGASFRQMLAIPEQLQFTRSLLRYFWKHQPRWQWLVLLAVTPVSLALAALVQIGERIVRPAHQR